MKGTCHNGCIHFWVCAARIKAYEMASFFPEAKTTWRVETVVHRCPAFEKRVRLEDLQKEHWDEELILSG